MSEHNESDDVEVKSVGSCIKLSYRFLYNSRSLGLGTYHDIPPLMPSNEKSWSEQLCEEKLERLDQEVHETNEWDPSKLVIPKQVRAVEFKKERITFVMVDGLVRPIVDSLETNLYFPDAKLMTLERYEMDVDPKERDSDEYGFWARYKNMVVLVTRHNELVRYWAGRHIIMDSIELFV